MVNSRHRICGAGGCAANATFRAPGDKHPTLCGAHRTEGMVQARTGAGQGAKASRTFVPTPFMGVSVVE